MCWWLPMCCPCALALELKNQPSLFKKVCAVVTDFGVHTYWPTEGVDAYFVAHEDIRRTLMFRGIAPHTIHVTGIPVRLGFEAEFSANHYPMDDTLRVLMTAGGVRSSGYLGFRQYFVDLIEALDEARLPQLQMTIVTGSQKRLEKELKRYVGQVSFDLRVLGFVKEMHHLMAEHDVLDHQARRADRVRSAGERDLPDRHAPQPRSGNRQRRFPGPPRAGAARAYHQRGGPGLEPLRRQPTDGGRHESQSRQGRFSQIGIIDRQPGGPGCPGNRVSPPAGRCEGAHSMSGYRQTLGRWGEAQAAAYLADQGYTLLGSNLRTPWGEIDLLAEMGGMLVFVEVKTRSSRAFGLPEAGVTSSKRAHMLAAVQSYMQSNSHEERDWRIDVIAIERQKTGGKPLITHFENALA
jgi:putative endonuclease